MWFILSNIQENNFLTTSYVRFTKSVHQCRRPTTNRRRSEGSVKGRLRSAGWYIDKISSCAPEALIAQPCNLQSCQECLQLYFNTSLQLDLILFFVFVWIPSVYKYPDKETIYLEEYSLLKRKLLNGTFVAINTQQYTSGWKFIEKTGQKVFNFVCGWWFYASAMYFCFPFLCSCADRA